MVSPAALARLAVVALAAAVLALAPAHAQRVVTVTTTTTVTTWTWEADDSDVAADDAAATRRYAPSGALAALGEAKARFGPFAVIDAATARMAGDVTSATPRQFATMLAAFPGLKRIEMVDCPGSLDEEANLILARAIRRAGLETEVPSGGSVRSGAVELWLAGVHRRAAPDAEFGVHSWIDEYGREARDYPASDPVHAEYLSYYREMGMDDAKARAFYALTNSTPFDDVRYLTRDDMARFVALN
ncbi:alpha/beta hydrolase [Sphingopyxis indica]|uniref:alpha/beta hydrolase n=1 Tax=Sphingopyxis indica TaxID=436663 RepID=UPI00293952AD|nr:alpha/beta hydrolase [Sphingopyxis indica]WOF43095.1 alpha/beta hydrolase [Sphingopyxis indica]